jgi:uncharacterized FlaG/YvyC family protein
MAVPPFEIATDFSATIVPGPEPVARVARTTPEGSQAQGATAGGSQPVPVTAAAVQAATEQLDAFMRSQNVNLEFRVDGTSRDLAVSVLDPASGKVLRQFPGEAVLALAQLLATEKNLGGNFIFDGRG